MAKYQASQYFCIYHWIRPAAQNSKIFNLNQWSSDNKHYLPYGEILLGFPYAFWDFVVMFQIFNITVITMCIRHSYWSFRICMGILHRGPFSSGGVAVVGRGAPQLHQLGDKWARPPRGAELRLRLPTGTLCWRLQMGQSQGHAGNIAVYMRKRSHLINLLGQYCLFYFSDMWGQCL